MNTSRLFSYRPKRSANRNCTALLADKVVPSLSDASFEYTGSKRCHRLVSVKSTLARSSGVVPAGPM